jgi:hypothetical protein
VKAGAVHWIDPRFNLMRWSFGMAFPTDLTGFLIERFNSGACTARETQKGVMPLLQRRGLRAKFPRFGRVKSTTISSGQK